MRREKECERLKLKSWKRRGEKLKGGKEMAAYLKTNQVFVGDHHCYHPDTAVDGVDSSHHPIELEVR